MDFSQGDIIKISGLRHFFLIVSKNAFIRAAGMFHVCPLLSNLEPGVTHIPVYGLHGLTGTVACEQIKLIDPDARVSSLQDRIAYGQLMEISDVIQGIFEYD